MQILSIMPAPGGDGRALAHFSLQLQTGVRLHSMRLVRNTAGELRVYGPNVYGQPSVTLTPDVAREVIALAQDALEAAYVRRAV